MKNSPASGPSSGKALHVALLFVVSLGLAAAIAMIAMLKRDLHTSEQELVELRQRPVPDPKVEKENQELRARVTDLETKLATAQTEAAAALTKQTASKAPVPVAPANPMAAIAATMNTPAMRSMMAATQKRALETRYAELFKQLRFTPEEQTRFIELLADGQSLTTESALKLAAGNLTPAEQAALKEQLKDVEAVKDEKVREFLGDEKYAAYKQYNELQTERSQVTALRRSLAQSGQPMSADQAAALTSMMYTERKSFSFSQPVNQNSADPTAMPSAETMEIHLREQEQLNNQIANRAAGILTPEQVTNLREQQARRLENMRASSELARQMLGGAPAAK